MILIGVMIGFVCLILPSWFILSLIVPILLVAQASLGVPPVAAVGSASFWLSDIALISVAYRVVCQLLLHETSRIRFRDLAPRGVYVLVGALAVAEFFAYRHSGVGITGPQTLSLARLLITQVGSMMLLVVSLRDRWEITKAIRCFMWFGLLAAVTVYASMIFPGVGEVSSNYQGTRYQGLVGDTVKILLLLFVFMEAYQRHLIRSAFLVIALLATGGRLGAIGLVIGLTMIAVTASHKTRVWTWFAVGSLACVIAIGFSLDIGSISNRVFHNGITGNGFDVRVATWMSAFQIFISHPIFGAGYGSYADFVSRYFVDYQGVLPFETTAYSQILSVAAGTGVVGVIAFVWFAVSCIRRIQKALSYADTKLYPLLLGGRVYVVVLVVMSPVLLWLLPGSLISYAFFFIIGIGSATLRVTRGVDMSANGLVRWKSQPLPYWNRVEHHG